MKKQIKVIGITGGIGSGKSFVSSIIAKKGFTIYEADKAAKEVMKSPNILEKLTQNFGSQVVQNGEIVKSELSKVFQHPKELQKLNSIVHPAVAEHFQNFLQILSSSYDRKMIFKEAAILFETGTWRQCDAVITVFAPQGIRIQRAMKRDNLTKEVVLSRISKQWGDDWKIKHSQYTIFNDGFQNLETQIDRVLIELEKSLV